LGLQGPQVVDQLGGLAAGQRVHAFTKLRFDLGFQVVSVVTLAPADREDGVDLLLGRLAGVLSVAVWPRSVVLRGQGLRLCLR